MLIPLDVFEITWIRFLQAKILKKIAQIVKGELVYQKQ